MSIGERIQERKLRQDCIKATMDGMTLRESIEYTRRINALFRMQRLEKRIKKLASIYFGEPVTVIYAKTGATVVHKDGTESKVQAG